MRVYRIGLPALLVLLLVGCASAAGNRAQSQEAVVVNGIPNVVIEDFNGNVEVVTGPAGKVSAEVRKHAQNAADLDKIAFAFSQSGQDVQARATWNGGATVNNAGVDLRVSVPPGSTVSVITGNGNIDYRAAPGKAIAATTGNGDITITLPQDARFSVKAVVGAGKIKSDFTLAPGSSQSDTRLEGATNAEPRLVLGLAAGNGDITITAAR